MTARVLVVRADNLGDVILAGPAIRAIAASGAHVTLLCSPHGEPVAHRLPGVQAVIVARLPWIDPDPDAVTPESMQALIETLERGRFDTAVILTSFHQSALPTALLLRMAGVRRIGGVSTDYPGALLDVAVRTDDDIHEVARSLRLVGRLGYTLPFGDDGRLDVEPGPKRDALAQQPYVLVHPGASVAARTWSPAKWVDAARALADEYSVVVTGSRRERDLSALVAGAAAQDLGGRCSFDDLRDLCANADVVVTGNTGPAHLAAATGTPVVSIFAPTVSPARWRPWQVPCEMLGDEHIPCAGCRSTICPLPGQPCIGNVTTTDVVDAVRRLHPSFSAVQS